MLRRLRGVVHLLHFLASQGRSPESIPFWALLCIRRLVSLAAYIAKTYCETLILLRRNDVFGLDRRRDRERALKWPRGERRVMNRPKSDP
jgi:hypothetical protein